MAWDDYLNKDAMAAGVLSEPDAVVRRAQAKLAVNAAHLLTSKEWDRLAQRQRLEQINAADAAKNMPRVQQGIQRFTPEEIAAANQPGTVPAEPKTPRMPGPGEMVEYGGVRYTGRGYDPTQQPPEGQYMVDGQLRQLPKPAINIDGRTFAPTAITDEYVNKAIDYISPPVVQKPVPSGVIKMAQVQQAPVTSTFQKELQKPSVPMQTGMKTVEELLPSLAGSQSVRANEAVADWMRGTAYGVSNVLRPSAWTSVKGQGNESWLTYTPEKSPAYLEQLKSRLSSLSDQSSPAAVSLKNEINKLSAPTAAGVIPTNALYRAFGVKTPPSLTANQLLGVMAQPQQTVSSQEGPKITVPKIGGQSQSPYDQVAQEPEPVMSSEAQQPQIDQEMAQYNVPATNALPEFKPLELPRYTSAQLNVKPFDARQLMTQPSASQTIGTPQALAAYKAQTEAQINAYKAQSQANLGAYRATTRAAVEEHKALRTAINDQLGNQLKGLQIKKAEADAISAQMANQFAEGGPQYGTFEVGGKTQGYIRTGPKTIKTFSLDAKKGSAEQNYEFIGNVNREIIGKIKSGDIDSALTMYSSLPGRKPEDFEGFKAIVLEASKSTSEPKSQTAVQPKAQTPAQPKPQGGVIRIKNPTTNEVREFRNGTWVTVK